MATASPLLRLPAELRNHVYEFLCLPDPFAVPPPISRSPVALSLTCRQLYDETHTLAFASTTFRASCWQLAELQTRIKRLRSTERHLVTRLELTVGIRQFLIHRQSLDGLNLAGAGLSNLEELYISYTGEPMSEWGETNVGSNLEVLLWRTVAGCGNNCLRKIRIVHGGTLCWYGIRSLYVGLTTRLPLRWAPDQVWQTRQNFAEGRFSLIGRQKDRSRQREIIILLGHTQREAEDCTLTARQLAQPISGSRCLKCVPCRSDV